jgi:hypothetical protein
VPFESVLGVQNPDAQKKVSVSNVRVGDETKLADEQLESRCHQPGVKREIRDELGKSNQENEETGSSRKSIAASIKTG